MFRCVGSARLMRDVRLNPLRIKGSHSMSVRQSDQAVVTGRAEGSGSLVALSSMAAAWVLSVAIDLFLHAGLLARLYVEPSPFLLPAEDAFRRIPLGYLTFFMLTIGLFWLLRRLHVRGIRAGFRVGAVAGATVWGALVLGLYSISTASVSLLAGWWVGQTVELAFAGAVLGAAADRVPPKRIWAIVSLSFVVLAAATVALQSLGLAPAMKGVP